MTRFVVLNMFPKSYSRSSFRPRHVSKPFLEWRAGDTVGKRGNEEHWKIASIESDRYDEDEPHPGETVQSAAMSYAATVHLVSADGEEAKTLKGSTLQTSYEFVSAGISSTPAEDPKMAGTKLAAFNVSLIRDFYARKDDRPGTRLLMSNGTPYIVAQSFEEVLAMVSAATDGGIVDSSGMTSA